MRAFSLSRLLAPLTKRKPLRRSQRWRPQVEQLEDRCVPSATYSSVILADSPTAYYRLGEASGITLTDSSGNGNNGSYFSSSVTPGSPGTLGVPGAIVNDPNTAVTFNGTTGFAQMPSTLFNFPTSTTTSFEVWFKTTSDGVILGQTNNGAIPSSVNPGGWVPALYVDTTGHLLASFFWHGGTGIQVVSPGTVNNGAWHDVVDTYNAGVETLYLDGTSVGSRSGLTENNYAGSYNYYLGTGFTAGGWANGNGGWFYFNGSLDEAAVYNYALTPQQIQTHYQTGISADPILDVGITDGTSNVLSGGSTTYTITVHNFEASTVSGAVITDAFPAAISSDIWNATQTGGATGFTASGSGSIGDTVTMPAGSTITYTVQANVNSTAVGNLADTVSAQVGSNNTSATDTDSLTFPVTTSLSVSKTAAATVLAGNQLSYTVTVTNTGAAAAQNVSLGDPLPPGTTFVSDTETGGPSFTPNDPAVGSNGNIIDTIGSLASGASATFTWVVQVPPDTADGTPLSNTVTAGANNATSGTSTTNTTAQTSADLTVSKSATAASVFAGNQLTYTITLANAGPSDAKTVALNDPLPAGVTFASDTLPGGWTQTNPGAGNPGTVTFSDADLAPTGGSPANFTITVNVPANTASGTVLSNTVTASTSTTSTGSTLIATASTTVNTQAILTVSKSAAASVDAGNQLTYTITVANTGPSDAQNVLVSDPLPSGTWGNVTFASDTLPGGWTQTNPGAGNPGTVTFSDADLAPTGGSPASFTITVNVPANTASGTVLSNTATVSGFSGPPVGPGLLAYWKLDDGSGTTAVDSTGDGNTGTLQGTPLPTWGTGKINGDIVLPGPTAKSAVNYGTNADLNFAAGQNFSITGWFNTTASNGLILSQRNNGNGNPVIDVGLGFDGLSTSPGHLMALIRDDAGSGLTDVVSGAAVNDGAWHSFAVVRSGTTWTLYLDGVSQGSNATSSGSITTNERDLGYEQEWFRSGYTATPGQIYLAGSLDNIAIYGQALTAAQINTLQTINSTPTVTSTANTTVQTSADLSINKTPLTQNGVPGNTVGFTIAVANSGPSDETGIAIADALNTPADVTNISWQVTGTTGTVTGLPVGVQTGAINLSGIAMSANSSITIAETDTINAAATGSFTNTATVTPGNAPDPTPSDETSTATVTLTPSTDLSIGKTPITQNGIPGNTVGFTILVGNIGPSDGTGISIVDALNTPADVTNISWQVTGTTGTVTGLPVGAQTGAINLSGISMATGSTITISETDTINPAATGSFTNTATVTPGSGQTDPTPSDETSTATVTLTPSTDLSISKTPTTQNGVPGNTVGFTIQVGNTGPSDGTGIAIADAVNTPADVTNISWQVTGTTGTVTGLPIGVQTGAINLTGIAMSANSSITIAETDTINPAATGSFTNTATVTPGSGQTDPTPLDETSTATVTLTPSAALTLAKSGPASVTNGNNFTYTLTLTNTGPSNAANIAVSDPLPNSTTFVSDTLPAGWTASAPAVGANGTVSFTNTSFAPGTAVFTIIVQANAPILNAITPVANTATATAADATSVTSNTLATTINGTPNAVYVYNVYEKLLDRAPDPGAVYWLQALNNGLAPSTFVLDVEQSTEYLTDVVASLYQHYLHRAPDAGAAVWVNELASGASIEQVIAALVSSPEYFADHGSTNTGFVEGLYQDILGRAADPAGLAAWVAQLGLPRAGDGSNLAGQLRYRMAMDFLTSTEYRADLVSSYYQNYLLRPADAAGLNDWVGALQSGLSDQEVLAAIFGSAEGYAKWS